MKLVSEKEADAYYESAKSWFKSSKGFAVFPEHCVNFYVLAEYIANQNNETIFKE